MKRYLHFDIFNCSAFFSKKLDFWFDKIHFFYLDLNHWLKIGQDV